MPTAFRDRTEAGQRLAERLVASAGRPDVPVLALPRGGVPVAYEVARATQMGAQGEWDVGGLVCRRYGHDAVLVGFTTHDGTVTAASNPRRGDRCAADAGPSRPRLAPRDRPALADLILASAIRLAAQWQRAVVFRLGKFREMKGPGLSLIIPLIDQMRMVDAREAGDDHEGRGADDGRESRRHAAADVADDRRPRADGVEHGRARRGDRDDGGHRGPRRLAEEEVPEPRGIAGLTSAP